jgi:Phage integrase family
VLMMHNVAAMVDIERAAFFAARCRAPMCQCRSPGRERPWVFACQLRPRRWHQRRSRPSRPCVVCHRRCPSPVPLSVHPHVMPLLRRAGQVVREDPFLPVPQTASSFWGPCMRSAITFCSHLAMRGAPARAIQELAGHQDLGTTQRYMHLSPAALDAAIRLLETGTDASSCSRGEIVEAAGTVGPKAHLH